MRCPPGMPTPVDGRAVDLPHAVGGVQAQQQGLIHRASSLRAAATAYGHAAGVAQRDLDARHAQMRRAMSRDAAVQRDERLATRQYLDVAPARTR